MSSEAFFKEKPSVINKFRAAVSARGDGRGTDSAGFDIYGGEVLLYGDPHFSAKFAGTHVNYIQNCYNVMSLILNQCKEAAERNGLASAIFLGDVFGVKERNIKDTAFLLSVINFFQQINALCDGNVFSVRGNHDFGDLPDFVLFEQLGLIKNPSYVDYWGSRDADIPELRFHFVNYGQEHNTLPIHENEDVSNIALCHNDFMIPGVTEYGGTNTNSIDTKRLVNFIGIDLVISGHIHTPTQGIVQFTIGDGSVEGSTVDFIYPGCPTRVSERYDDCYYCSFQYDSESGTTEFEPINMGLIPASEEFLEKQGTVEEVMSLEIDTDRTKRLTELLESLRDQSVFAGSPEEQIRNAPLVSPAAKKVALEYLNNELSA